MTETKILYGAVERGQPRVPVVDRKEWETIFAEYTSADRRHAANLAAHNWDVVMVEGRIAVMCPWSGGDWIGKDGERVELTAEELDAFYPRSMDPEKDRYRTGFTTRWVGPLGQQTMIVRQSRVVMP